MCCDLHANRFTNNTIVTSRVLTDDLRLDHHLRWWASWGRRSPVTLTYAVTWAPVRVPAEVTAPEVAEPVLV